MQIFFAGWTRKTDLKVGGAGVKERDGVVQIAMPAPNSAICKFGFQGPGRRGRGLMLS
jgi:hypothetical protein